MPDEIRFIYCGYACQPDRGHCPTYRVGYLRDGRAHWTEVRAWNPYEAQEAAARQLGISRIPVSR